VRRRDFLKKSAWLTGSFLLGGGWSGCRRPVSGFPHIIFIMADDMGYGDLSCLNPESRIPTPQMDRLAAEGVVFTDAHSGSSVCTPTRYGLLTGRYSWRTRLKKGVLNGYSRCLIETDRLTVASLLKKHGYHTACIGKWHLGLTEYSPERPNLTLDEFTRPLRPGPNELGFDYWFGIPASLDMAPYVYIRNGVVTAPPTGRIEASPYPAFYRRGPIAPDFRHEEVLPRLAEEAVQFIRRHQRSTPERPFFLYLALTAPHTPWVPLPAFRGRSRAGLYGDFVTQVDDVVGRLLRVLDEERLAGQTLVILTSDNGADERFIGDYNNGVSGPGANFGHEANYIYRGQKSDIWDGGHRIPFIARWPGVIRAGRQCSKLVCLTDLLATCAELVGAQLPENAGEDSFSFLPYLQGRKPSGPVREAVVHHSIDGSFALRRGRWKYIATPGSGGWSKGGDKWPAQLYDMKADLSERRNLYGDPAYQEIVEELKALLRRCQEQGFTRPR